ncbi:MAG: hypothetical protein R3F54_06895 [Alphaproteobacteria bacterium]
MGKAFYQPSETPTSKPRDEAAGEPRPEQPDEARDGTIGPDLDDAVTEGVRLGYSVIEDQIRQAQGLASKLSPGSQGLFGSGLPGGNDEIRSLLDRLLRTYGDLTNVWLQVLNAALGNADILNALFGKDGAKPNGASAPGAEGERPAARPSSEGTAAVAVSVQANGPVETNIRLFGGGLEATSVVLQDLRARESGVPPLNDVTLMPAREGEPMRVVVKVPEEQPHGLYQGLILDQRNDTPIGVLGIRLGPA